jgi:hypothetical protein
VGKQLGDELGGVWKWNWEPRKSLTSGLMIIQLIRFCRTEDVE